MSQLLVALLLPFVGASSTAPALPEMLYVRDDAGWEPVSGLEVGVFPLGMQSRSELLPRFVRTLRGVGVRLVASTERALELDSVRLVAIPHVEGARIQRTVDGDALYCVTPTRSPQSVTRPDADEELLPWIARQDGVGLSGTFVVHLGEPLARTESLIWNGCELASGDLDLAPGDVTWTAGEQINQVFGPTRPWELPNGWPTGLPEAQLRFEAQFPIDEVLVARVERVEPNPSAALALRSAHTIEGTLTGECRRNGLGPYWPRVEPVPNAQELDAREALAARSTSQQGAPFVLAPGKILELWFDAPESRAGETSTLVFLVERTRRSTGPVAMDHGGPASHASNSRAASLFHDVTRDAGIEFVHLEGPDEQLDIRPTMGPGAAWGDVDGDGWNDLFLPQGGGRDGSRVPTAKLYRNKHDGTFEDVTARANLGVQGRGMGALFLDVDGDGDLDLFVANYGANKLYLNDGAGRFTDVTLAAGLPQDERWHAAVSAADYDRDGDLDLYVTSYLDYDPAKMPPADELGRYQREDPLEMLPFAFPGERKQLLRNDRIKSGPTDASAPRDPSQPNVKALLFRFTDVTDELHVADANGRGMQAIFWDFDQDGDQDLYVANDVSPNTFYRNEGDGTWKDISLATGLDDPRGSMGLAVGDVDGDGDEDLFVTNWQLESNALYVNNLVTHSSAKHRVATFRDQSVQAGLAQLSVGVTSWGSELADLDLDGDLDLVYANGYTSPDYESTGICVGQPSHLFLNDGTGKFTPAFELAGPDLAEPLPSRCLLACDYDQDGDLDLAITANNARARLLRNDARVRGKDGAVTGLAANRHWLGLRLRARGANRFAIGAEVRVEAGGRTLLRTLRAGTSYLGGNAPELHVGLGDASKVDGVRVRWPDGKTSTHAVSSVDAFVVLTEPE